MAPALPIPCLCLVTDRRSCAGRPLSEVVARAVDGGVNMVQLREKDLPVSQLLELALQLRDITAGRALLFVNDRVDVALACAADGVQLGEQGMPVDAARDVAGRRLLIGRSVHSVEGAVAAQREGADLLVVGTIFPSESHPGAPAAGLALLRGVGNATRIPFLAIGGLNAGNVASAAAAGAHGAAVITAITRSPNPRRAASRLLAQMNTVRVRSEGEQVARTR